MTTIFKKILSVAFLHDFFQSGKNKMLKLGVPSLTESFLANHKLKALYKDSTLSVLSKVTQSGSVFTPVISLDVDASLVFTLDITDGAYMNITDLPTKTNSDAIYYLTNLNSTFISNNDGELITEQLLLYPERFNYEYITTDDSDITLKFYTYSGDEISALEQTIEGVQIGSSANYKFFTLIDLSAYQQKAIRIEVYQDATEITAEAKLIFISSELTKRKPFAILDLSFENIAANLNNGFLVSEFVAYSLNNAPEPQLWTYEISFVNKSTSGTFDNGLNGKHLQIQDATGSPVAISAYVPVTSATLEKLTISVTSTYSYKEAGVTKLELTKSNDGSGTGKAVLLSNLANPSVLNPQAIAYITI